MPERQRGVNFCCEAFRCLAWPLGGRSLGPLGVEHRLLRCCRSSPLTERPETSLCVKHRQGIRSDVTKHGVSYNVSVLLAYHCFYQRVLSGGLDLWGVVSTNLGCPIFASKFPQIPLKQALSRKNWMQLFCLQLEASCLQWSFFTYSRQF